MWRVSVDIKSFMGWAKASYNKLRGEVALALDRAATEVQTMARTGFNSRTGQLSRSIKTRKINQYYSRNITAHAPHAGFVENGTKAHDITAKGGALRFVMNGRVMFRRTVHHPGTKATHFMANSGERVRPLFQQLLLEAVNRSFR